MTTEFEKMVEAFRNGRILHFEADEKGGIKFAGSYESDKEAALGTSCDFPGQGNAPQMVLVRGHLHEIVGLAFVNL